MAASGSTRHYVIVHGSTLQYRTTSCQYMRGSIEQYTPVHDSAWQYIAVHGDNT